MIYSLFFGIGALGEGGGDPGFMLPAPILPATIVSLNERKLHVFVQNALLPYGFWALTLFAFYCTREVVRNLKRPKPVA